MANLNWTTKTNDVDDVLAEDFNNLVSSIETELEKKVDKEDGKGLSAVSDISIMGGGTIGITPPDNWKGIMITKTNGTIEDVDFYNKDQMKEKLNTKVDKVDGKGLSTNDYTDNDKAAVTNLGYIDDIEPSYNFNRNVSIPQLYTNTITIQNNIHHGEGGFAAGDGATSEAGGIALGYNASAMGGIQLGTGTNSNSNTLQFLDYQLMDADGDIPTERLNNVRSVRPDVKNTIDTIAVNTIYDLGMQTTLNITLPSGQIGDFAEFDFISGETATNLTVNSSSGLVGFDLIPGTNTIYTLYFDWGVAGYDGTSIKYGWRCNYSEYSITV